MTAAAIILSSVAWGWLTAQAGVRVVDGGLSAIIVIAGSVTAAVTAKSIMEMMR